MELETQLLIARDLGYIGDEHELYGLLADVTRLLNGLQASLKPSHESSEAS